MMNSWIVQGVFVGSFFGEFRFSKGVDENVNACFYFSLALQWTGILFRVSLCPPPITAGIGSSRPLQHWVQQEAGAEDERMNEWT